MIINLKPTLKHLLQNDAFASKQRTDKKVTKGKQYLFVTVLFSMIFNNIQAEILLNI